MNNNGKSKYRIDDNAIGGTEILWSSSNKNVAVSESYTGTAGAVTVAGIVTITGPNVVNNEFVVAADGLYQLCVSANCQTAFGWIRNSYAIDGTIAGVMGDVYSGSPGLFNLSAFVELKQGNRVSFSVNYSQAGKVLYKTYLYYDYWIVRKIR